MSKAENIAAEKRENALATLLAVREKMEAMAAGLPDPIADQLREIMEFRVSLTSETDRGSVLMAAAFLDDRLKLLLAARIVNDTKLARRAFDFNGPLGTFSSRIDFSYLLGLLPRNAQRDLHLIRSVRNKFAHNAAPIGFDNPDVKLLCDRLIFHGVQETTDPGAKFRRSAMGLLSIILVEMNKAEHITPLPDAIVPDRTEAYEFVSAIWANVSGGLPYPVAHHHTGSSDAVIPSNK